MSPTRPSYELSRRVCRLASLSTSLMMPSTSGKVEASSRRRTCSASRTVRSSRRSPRREPGTTHRASSRTESADRCTFKLHHFCTGLRKEMTERSRMIAIRIRVEMWLSSHGRCWTGRMNDGRETGRPGICVKGELTSAGVQTAHRAPKACGASVQSRRACTHREIPSSPTTPLPEVHLRCQEPLRRLSPC